MAPNPCRAAIANLPCHFYPNKVLFLRLRRGARSLVSGRKPSSVVSLQDNLSPGCSRTHSLLLKVLHASEDSNLRRLWNENGYTYHEFAPAGGLSPISWPAALTKNVL
jgi:hypothetical protein